MRYVWSALFALYICACLLHWFKPTVFQRQLYKPDIVAKDCVPTRTATWELYNEHNPTGLVCVVDNCHPECADNVHEYVFPAGTVLKNLQVIIHTQELEQ